MEVEAPVVKVEETAMVVDLKATATVVDVEATATVVMWKQRRRFGCRSNGYGGGSNRDW